MAYRLGRTRAAGDRDREQRLAVLRLQARQNRWTDDEADDRPRRRQHRTSRIRGTR